MPWKLKLIVLGMFCLWCVLLWYISFHMDWNKDERYIEIMRGANKRIQQKHFKFVGGKPVQVFLAADENSVGGMIAAINSIVKNTKNPINFFLVTNGIEDKHLMSWIERSELSRIKYNLTIFPYGWIKGKVSMRGQELPNHMDYAKFYIPFLFPKLNDTVVYIDNDVIVQGDIAELASTVISDGKLGAFSEDCQSVSKRLSPIQNTYASYINFNNYHVQRLNMNPAACSFNTGVFVVNMTVWKNNNITGQLEHWMILNKKEKIYVSGGAQPPIMIVFYKKIAKIDPLWHVRHLGVTGASHYSVQFLKQAKLLHWDGHYKPWTRRSANTDLWDKYYVNDPSGHFMPVRKNI